MGSLTTKIQPRKKNPCRSKCKLDTVLNHLICWSCDFCEKNLESIAQKKPLRIKSKLDTVSNHFHCNGDIEKRSVWRWFCSCRCSEGKGWSGDHHSHHKSLQVAVGEVVEEEAKEGAKVPVGRAREAEALAPLRQCNDPWWRRGGLAQELPLAPWVLVETLRASTHLAHLSIPNSSGKSFSTCCNRRMFSWSRADLSCTGLVSHAHDLVDIACD